MTQEILEAPSVSVENLSDRRQARRVGCQLSTSQRDSISNISESGALLMARRKLTIGEKINLAFHLPNGAKPLRLDGKIVRKAGPGAADSKVINYIASKLKKIRHSATIIKLPDTAHYPQLERPELYYREIANQLMN